MEDTKYAELRTKCNDCATSSNAFATSKKNCAETEPTSRRPEAPGQQESGDQEQAKEKNGDQNEQKR